MTWPALAACLLLALLVSWPAQGVGRGPRLLPVGAEVAHMICGKGGVGDLVLDLYRATRPPEPSQPAVRGSRGSSGGPASFLRISQTEIDMKPQNSIGVTGSVIRLTVVMLSVLVAVGMLMFESSAGATPSRAFTQVAAGVPVPLSPACFP